MSLYEKSINIFSDKQKYFSYEFYVCTYGLEIRTLKSYFSVINKLGVCLNASGTINNLISKVDILPDDKIDLNIDWLLKANRVSEVDRIVKQHKRKFQNHIRLSGVLIEILINKKQSREAKIIIEKLDYFSMNKIYFQELQGWIFMGLEEWTNALTIYEDILRKNPISPEDLYHLGLCYSRLNKQRKAKSIIEKVDRLSPFLRNKGDKGWKPLPLY